MDRFIDRVEVVEFEDGSQYVATKGAQPLFRPSPSASWEPSLRPMYRILTDDE